MSERVTTNYFAYQGPLGDVVRDGVFYFASKDGFPIGTYDTFEEAMASLEWKGRVKAPGYFTIHRSMPAALKAVRS